MSADPNMRAPRWFTVAVCCKCRAEIPTGAAKVSVGTGWVCQRCAYAAYRAGLT